MSETRFSQDDRKAFVFLAVLLFVALAFAAVIAYPFFKPLAYAFILATVFHPLYSLLHKRTRRPNLSAFISTAIIFLMIIVPLVVLLNVAAVQAVSLAHGIAARSASQGGFVPYLAHLLQRPLEFFGRFVDLSNFNLRDQIAEHLQTLGLKLLPTAASLVGNLFSAIAGTLLALIACYFLLRDGERITRKAVELIPISDDHAARLIETLKNAILANVQGVFAVGIAQGIATGIALAVLGVGPATLLGILAAFCSIIPVIGTGLVWGPAAIYLVTSGHVVKGVVLLGIGIGVISMLDNIIRPLVVGTRVQANAFVLMLAMLGGVNAFGFLGLFIGPVVAAMLIALGGMLTEEMTHSQEEESQRATATR